MVIYRCATEKDMDAVAAIHKECFQGYFLTALGKNLLKKYYLQFLKEEDLFIVAELPETKQIAGFCMGYRYFSKARDHFESNNKVALALRLLWLCVTFNPEAIKRCKQRIKMILQSNQRTAQQKNEQPRTDAASLLSIALLPEYRSHSSEIAKNMVKTFEELLIKRGIQKYTLSVYENNAGARKFYEKMDMKATAHYAEDDSVEYTKILVK